MNKSVKHKEFDKFRRAINISIDGIHRRLDKIDRLPGDIASKRELLSDRNLNNAKFDAFEEAINLIFSILESHNLNIKTCMHCKQPLPKADNES
jgi:hypothetical protein